MEQGTAPWHKPWQEGEHTASYELPVNIDSGKRYKGINIALLWLGEFPTNEFGTFKQWSDRKETIRKGSKGTTVVYYDFIEKQKEGKEEIDKIPFLKTYTVFNRSQLQSYKETEPQPRPVLNYERIHHIDQFVAKTGAVVYYQGDRAFYSHRTDEITMPERRLFTGTPTQTVTESIYAVLAHELTHWTGPKHRLNRDMGKKYGDKNYALEEVVAEMGSAFLCADWGIADAPRPDHAQYISHWLKAFSDNTKLVIPMASQASKAFEYLHSLQEITKPANDNCTPCQIEKVQFKMVG
ncbi:ssDNA-binding domain-containing protein [Dyadobacter sp. CY327]|nr:ssDNA-binding domain-containing protein [Dyadobacter sp. CY327]